MDECDFDVDFEQFENFEENLEDEICEEEEIEELVDYGQIVQDQIYQLLLPLILKKPIEPSYMHLHDEEENERDYCIILFKNGNTYEGEMVNYRLHGYGTYNWLDGSSYEGSFHRNFPFGYGELLTKHLSYVGKFSEGAGHGIGKLETLKYTYYGHWRDGEFNGCGMLDVKDLCAKGIFANNKLEYGLREYLYGKYVGKFDKSGSRLFGKFMFKNNDTYYGSWSADLYSDYGEYAWFKEIYRQQHCLLSTKDDEYNGFWARGQRHGYGILHFDDVIIYCRWNNNKKDGPGLIISANGGIYASNTMFNDDIYEDGLKIMKNDETIEIVRSIFDSTECNPISYKYYSCESKLPAYQLCNEIVREKIEILLTHGEIFETGIGLCSYPLFIPNFLIDEYLPFLDFIKEFYPNEDTKTFNSKEINSLNQVIIENFKLIEKIYLKYATMRIKDRSFRKYKNDICMNQIGIWLLYRDVFYNIRKICIYDEIIKCNEKCLIFKKNPLNPFEKYYFWQFLRHLIHIVVVLNERNCTIREIAMNENYRVFGLFATMFLIFLRSFSSIDYESSLLHKTISNNESLTQYILINIQSFHTGELTFRDSYKFIEYMKSKLPMNCDVVYPLSTITDDDFLDCSQKLFPQILEDNLLVETVFNITPLQLYEIILFCFERSVSNDKVKIIQEEMILAAAAESVKKPKQK